MKKKLVVLGAGITGLRIAAYLIDKYDVTVIEKTGKVGGMCASFDYNGYTLDYGPHKFYTQLDGVYDDFKEILGEGNYLKVEKKNSVRLLGKYFDFPVKMSELFTKLSPLTSFQIGLDFAMENLKRRKVTNYEDYFVRGFGRKGYSIIFEGFARKLWGDPRGLEEELARKRSPVSNVFDVLKTALFRKDKNVSAEWFYYPKKGYGAICESLARKITLAGGKIILNARPDKIKVLKKKVKEVQYSIENKKKKISCDILVSTLAIDDLPNIIEPSPPKDILKHLKNLKFRSIIVGYVFLNKPRALKHNWIFFPETEFRFNRVAEQKSFSEETVPKDKTVLTAEITCDFGDATYNLSDKDLREIIVKDLVKANLIKEDEVIDFISRRAGRVYPVYSIGYKNHLNKVLSYLDEIDNIYTVGRLGLYNYNNADHCLDMAKVTASVISEGKSRQAWASARKYFDGYRIVD